MTALLTVSARRTNGATRPGARKHLLSWGIGECGVCGGKLRAVTKRGRYGRPLDLYVCDDKGCVGRSKAAVEDLVKQVVIGRLSMPDALEWLLGDDQEARRWSERVDELNDDGTGDGPGVRRVPRCCCSGPSYTCRPAAAECGGDRCP